MKEPVTPDMVPVYGPGHGAIDRLLVRLIRVGWVQADVAEFVVDARFCQLHRHGVVGFNLRARKVRDCERANSGKNSGRDKAES